MYVYMYDIAKLNHSTCTYSSINSYYYMYMHFVLHIIYVYVSSFYTTHNKYMYMGHCTCSTATIVITSFHGYVCVIV